MHCFNLSSADICETCVTSTVSKRCNGQRRQKRRSRRDHARWTKRKQSKKLSVKTNTSTVNKLDSNVTSGNQSNKDKSLLNQGICAKMESECKQESLSSSHEEINAEGVNVLVYDSDDESDSDAKRLVKCEHEHTCKENKGNCSLCELHQLAHHILHFEEQYHNYIKHLHCHWEEEKEEHEQLVTYNQCKAMRKYLMQIGGAYKSLAAGKEFCVWLKSQEYNFDLVHDLRNQLLYNLKQMHNTNKLLQCMSEVCTSNNGVNELECELHRFTAAHHETIQHVQNSMLITLLELSAPTSEKHVDDLNTEYSHMDSQASAAHVFPDSQAELSQCRKGNEQIIKTPNEKTPKAMHHDNTSKKIETNEKNNAIKGNDMHDHYELSPGEKAALALLSMNDIFAEESKYNQCNEQRSDLHQCETLTKSTYNEESNTINEFSAAAIYSHDVDKENNNSINSDNNFNSSGNNNALNNRFLQNTNRLGKSASLSGNLIAKQLRQSQQK